MDISLLPCKTFIEPSIFNLVKSNLPIFAKDDFKPDSRLFIDNLKSIDALSWLSKMDFKLIVKPGCVNSELLDFVPFDAFRSLEDFYEHLLSLDCQSTDPINPERPILAVDLETTGLNNRAMFINSTRKPGAEIVGVSIAVSDSKSFYIPVLHNIQDGIVNWHIFDIQALFALLQETFTLVWHNGAYDISICTSNGIYIDNRYNYCSLITSKALMMDEYDSSFSSNGLKFLSEKVLGRKMVEIHELFSLPKGSHISFETLPAVNALVYAASDAANTYGIWNWSNSHERALIKQGTLAFKLEMYSVYNTTALLDCGFMLDIDYLNSETTDLIIQQIQLEEQFAQFASVSTFTSPESLGAYLANFILSKLEDSGLSHDNALKFLSDKFSVSSTTQTLKSGQTKIKWKSGDEVLSSYLDNIHYLSSYLEGSDIDHLKLVIELVNKYRSLNHTIGMFLGAIRNLRVDDRGAFAFFTLNQNGTKTGRYSNGKTRLDRFVFSITAKTRKLSSSFKDSSCIFNAQGLPGFYPTYKNVEFDNSVPSDVLRKYKELYKKARERMSWMILSK